MHFKADIRDPQHLTNLTMISASGFQVELIPTRFDQSIDLDDLQLFKVGTPFNYFRPKDNRIESN